MKDMAVIMTVYEDFPFVLKNVEYLYTGFDVYMHIDKKSRVPDDLYQKINELGNVQVFSIYKVNWGGINHLKAVITLIKEAYENNPDYQRYVIMSGNEASIYEIDDIKKFFYTHEDKNYIEMSLPGINGNNDERKENYHFLHKYKRTPSNLREKIQNRFWIYIEHNLKKAGIKHKVKYDYQYKGYLYCALNRNYIARLLHNMEKLEEMMKEIKYFFVGEEYLFPNILSDDQEISESIESDSLIYDDWSKPDLGTPRYLTEEDIPEIKKSGKLFIRKAGNKTDVSRILLSHLYKYHF